MPLSYAIDSERRLLRIIAVGEVSPSEDRALNRAWASDPRYVPGMAILVDNRARAAGAKAAYVKAMAVASRRHAHLFENTRCALVVSRDVQYGMSRMYELCAEGGPIETAVFRSVEDAEAWLGILPGPGPEAAPPIPEPAVGVETPEVHPVP